MAYDDDEDWDMLGEDSQLKGEDAAGWGVDSSLYTTNLSESRAISERKRRRWRDRWWEKRKVEQEDRWAMCLRLQCHVSLSLSLSHTHTIKHTQYSDAEQRRGVEGYLRGRCDENACTSTQAAAATIKEARTSTKDNECAAYDFSK